jgi:microsomal dipeptidase-like Zn-dependent dipeptidase
METPDKIANLIGGLTRRQYTQEEMKKISFDNLMMLFKKVWK